MEREGTEKEPVVSEWPYEKDMKKDQMIAEQPPKLSLKLLHGMIQELQQYNERIAARLDEFEIYLIQVQAARAQLEASAASTIAKAKAVAVMHEQSVARDANAEATEEAAERMARPNTVDADAREAGHTMADAMVSADHSATSADTVMAPDLEDAMDEAMDERPVPAPAFSADSVDTADVAPEMSNAADRSAAVDIIEAVPGDWAIIAAEQLNTVQMGVAMKPANRESGSNDLMTLAMEVLGFTSDAYDEDSSEDGIDPGEGVNPFDPDSFAGGSSAYAYAAADASPELRAQAQTSSPSSNLSSPFFMPRSQRHQAGKKKFLSLFGFRTRIS